MKKRKEEMRLGSRLEERETREKSRGKQERRVKGRQERRGEGNKGEKE